MLKVVNKYKHTKLDNEIDIYIGRGSILGNPYTSIKNRTTKAKCICESREESINNFEKYLLDKINKKDKDICNELNKVYKLIKEGYTVNLVCFCKPKSCHGDIIKRFILEKL